MLKAFVDALNALHGQVFLFFLALVVILLVYARYRKLPPTMSILETLNDVHVTILGFVVACLGMLMVMSGHDKFGEEVFVSGASFMGGVGVSRLINGNGGAQKPPTP